jgi:hypothetical protein
VAQRCCAIQWNARSLQRSFSGGTPKFFPNHAIGPRVTVNSYPKRDSHKAADNF